MCGVPLAIYVWCTGRRARAVATLACFLLSLSTPHFYPGGRHVTYRSVDCPKVWMTISATQDSSMPSGILVGSLHA